MERITAKKEGDGIILEYYDSPEPKQQSEKYKTYHGLCRTDEWKKDYDNWQASKKTVRVHADAIDDLIQALGYVPINEINVYSFWKKLEKGGIPCDELKDRIEISEYFFYNEDGSFKNKEYFAILKPLPLPMEESQEENQTVLAGEIISLVKNYKGSGTALFEILNRYKLTRNK